MQTATTIEEVKGLIRLINGDEKHDASAHSTLDVLYVLYEQVLHYDPQLPRSEERDRFLLSKGHGPQALYAILAAKGFFPTSELAKFEKRESILGHHPDRNKVPGIEISTGSLGHGLPMAIGVALALRAKHSKRRVFVLIGDGECNEGSMWEAILLAGNLRLPNLTAILINNHSSSRDFDDFTPKFAAFHWHPIAINGRDQQEIYQALTTPHPEQPTIVIADIASSK
jgi:transketolase